MIGRGVYLYKKHRVVEPSLTQSNSKNETIILSLITKVNDFVIN